MKLYNPVSIRNKAIVLASLLVIILFFTCKESTEETGAKTENVSDVVPMQATITNTYKHDTTAFTEGLFIDNNKMYESTGATKELPQTRSLYGIVDTNTGKIDVKVELDKKKYFGEGITKLNNKIYQLTYQTKIGFVYDANNNKQISTFTIPSAEGWGFTNDGKHLIMSDGTSALSFLDTNSLTVINKITVTEDSYAINYINELEYVNGYIYANVFTTNYIIKIDPKTGRVVGKLDASNIAYDANASFAGSAEMNGIAYSADKNKFYLTGKLWPKIYEVDLK